MLRRDRSLLVFPILSAISIAIAAAVIWTPALVAGLVAEWDSLEAGTFDEEGWADTWAPIAAALSVVTAYVSTFLAVFFNVALASCASRSLDGEDTKVREGLAAAGRRVGQIAAWALLATTVGLLLRAVADRVPALARIVISIVGVLWTIATYLVVPVLAHERVGPFKAVGRSASIIRQRWGEQITGTFGIGILAFLAIVVVGAATAALAAAVGASAAAVATVIAIGLACILAIVVIALAMTQVFHVALYRYATSGAGTEDPAAERVTGPFSVEDLERTFRHKRL